ncbi:MAG TPA: bifunctional riboflavin kinase/FAD synthetase [Anaerolineales bacterium]|nr:bifunctional riboflavin kinase/FAD synthetase [Anaerolineales bacterium]
MLNYWSLEPVTLQNAWVTIGSFDGVHLGHQTLVKNLVSGAHAAGAPAVVLTFYPHPRQVLSNKLPAIYLTSPEQRNQVFRRLGIDVVVHHPFNIQVASQTADEFVERLDRRLGLKHLWVGADFALGRDRKGDVEHLRALGETYGFVVHAIEPILLDSQVVSSSRIRAALEAGNLDHANRLLGRPYQLCGEVVPGDGRGRTIGVPTANLAVWSARALPAAGVYVCRAHLRGRTRGAVVNIGVRPTFEEQPVAPRVEAHIFDLDEDLYGERLCLDFLARLRAEKRFTGIDTLVAQIQADMIAARAYLAAPVSS